MPVNVKLTEDRPVATVGELKRLLDPYVDDCEITDLNIYYKIDDDGDARLEIRTLIDDR